MQIILSRVEGLRYYAGRTVPASISQLHPDAAASILQLEKDTGGLVYTDLWRSAAMSYAARNAKKGVQPAGFSAHNYGFAIDFDVDGTMKLKHWAYADLLKCWGEHGWYCHRRDGGSGFESWHANYLGPDAGKYLALTQEQAPSTWANAVEQKIIDHYGEQMKLTKEAAQRALAKIGMYHGDIDGFVGAQTTAALIVFQRAWGLLPAGLLDERTQRTLAFVTAEKEFMPIPGGVPHVV